MDFVFYLQKIVQLGALQDEPTLFPVLPLPALLHEPATRAYLLHRSGRVPAGTRLKKVTKGKKKNVEKEGSTRTRTKA